MCTYARLLCPPKSLMPSFGLTDMLRADISLSVCSLCQNSLLFPQLRVVASASSPPESLVHLGMPHSAQPLALALLPLPPKSFHFPSHPLKHIYLFRPKSIILKFNKQTALFNSSQRTQNSPVTTSVSCSGTKTKQAIAFCSGEGYNQEQLLWAALSF